MCKRAVFAQNMSISVLPYRRSFENRQKAPRLADRYQHAKLKQKVLRPLKSLSFSAQLCYNGASNDNFTGGFRYA